MKEEYYWFLLMLFCVGLILAANHFSEKEKDTFNQEKYLDELCPFDTEIKSVKNECVYRKFGYVFYLKEKSPAIV